MVKIAKGFSGAEQAEVSPQYVDFQKLTNPSLLTEGGTWPIC